jgi:ferredoxin/flavodoxin
MSKVLIHFFTGTGNSARVGELVAQGLQKSGYEVQLQAVTSRTPLPGGRYDLHVFTFPTYSFVLPSLMKKYLKRLPEGAEAKAVVLAIFGVPGYEGRTLADATRILQQRGYDVMLTEAVGCPESFTQVSNPPEAEERKHLAGLAETKAELITQKIIAGEWSLKPCTLLNRLWTGAIGFLFTVFGRRLLGKIYIADQKCTQCKKCVQSCPAGAVKLRFNQPRWNYQCQACQRCINLCPQTAIQTSWLRPVIIVGLCFLPYYNWAKALWGAWMPSGLNHFLSFGLSIIIWSIGYLVAFYLVDKVIFFLETVPPLRKVISFSFTTNFRRYIEPHFRG